MTDYTEKVRQNAVVTIAVIVLSALIITLAILLYTGILGSNNLSFLPFVDGNLAAVDESGLDDIDEMNLGNIDDPDFINQINGTGNESEGLASLEKETGLRHFNRVNVAMLLGPAYDVEVEGKKRGCDTVWMVERQVTPTPAPLGAALKELFTPNPNLAKVDFYPGNYIDNNHPNVNLQEVRIENKIAKVYLTGSFNQILSEDEEGEEGEVCEDRARIQIEETALQFGTVEAVEIYLNGNLY